MRSPIATFSIAIFLALGLPACAVHHGGGQGELSAADGGDNITDNPGIEANTSTVGGIPDELLEQADSDLAAADGSPSPTLEDTDKRKEGWGSSRGTIKMNGLAAPSLDL